MTAASAETGAFGERKAVEYLRGEGYLIRDRNWRNGRYELDIVAERDGILHFVEVKCRTADSLLPPEEAMNASKCRALLKAVNLYIAMYGLDMEARIDLIAVDRFGKEDCEIRFIPDAVRIGW